MRLACFPYASVFVLLNLSSGIFWQFAGVHGFQLGSAPFFRAKNRPAACPSRSKGTSLRTLNAASSGRLSSSSSLSLSDAAITSDGDEQTSSSPDKHVFAATTFGLIKAMVGCGVLALPAGLAAITDYPSGLWPASALCLILGVASGYTFSLYGRLTHATQATSLGDLWKQVNAQSGRKNSSSSSQAVSLTSFIYCFGCALMFSLIIGASLSSLLRGAPFASMLPAWALTRQASILAVTATALFPLCNLPSLAALAPVSVIGVVGTIIITAFMAFRCPAVVPSSPYAVPGSGLLSNVASNLQPSFCSYNRFFSPAPLVLIAMASVALMAHFSAPEFYHSLAPTSSRQQSDSEKTQPDDKVLRNFKKMTALGYLTVAIINGLILAFGFLTFGGNCDGMVLNNYSNMDFGANLSRLLIIVSIIGSYPFIMVAGRSAALELFSAGKQVTRKREFRMTGILLAIATAISLVVTDVGFVVSFNGALMGSIIIYTFPALLFLKQTASTIANGEKLTRLIRFERWLCRFLVGFGGISAVIGGATSVIVSFFPHLLQ